MVAHARKEVPATFAISHAATALAIKRRFPDVNMLWVLLSVQFVEFMWVVLNLVGVEKTTTESVVLSVRDIHLAYMPVSHSVAGTFCFAFLAWLIIDHLLDQHRLAIAVAVGILSHLFLDVATHDTDIAVVPWLLPWEIGSGFYAKLPRLAFFVELTFGVACWRYYRGSFPLLLTIIAFNVANVSLFFPEISGLEALLAGRPRLVVGVVFVQILVTLALVGWLARRPQSDHSPT